MGLAYSKKKQNSHRIRNTVLILTALIVIFLLITGYETYNVYQTELPSFEQLHNIEPSIKTKVIR